MIIEELIDSKNEIWNRFLLQSKNANIFSHSFYDDLNQDYDIKKILIKKGTENIASFRIFSKEKTVYNANNLYCPINYRNIYAQNKASNHHEKNEVLKKIINLIFSNYENGSFTLDYNTNDLREFDFFNYIKKKKFFSIEQVRYTTVLQTKNLEQNYDNLRDSFFFKNCAESNRRKIVLSQNKNYIFIEDNDINDLKKILIKTYERNNYKLDFDIDSKIIFLKRFLKSLISLSSIKI